MGNAVLAIYLIVVGIIGLFSLGIPAWVAPVLALIAGILLLIGR